MESCAVECAKVASCSFFSYGFGDKELDPKANTKGKCYLEDTQRSDCPEGFMRREFDFYELSKDADVEMMNADPSATPRIHLRVSMMKSGILSSTTAFWSNPRLERCNDEADSRQKEAATKCPSGWLPLHGETACISETMEKETWRRAQHKCSEFGGHVTNFGEVLDAVASFGSVDFDDHWASHVGEAKIATCSDVPGWKDGDGHGCRDYYVKGRCFAGSPFVRHENETIKDLHEAFSFAVGREMCHQRHVACCACGGGSDTSYFVFSKGASSTEYNLKARPASDLQPFKCFIRLGDSARCPAGWIPSKNGATCLSQEMPAENALDATDSCISLGGHLASLTDYVDQCHAESVGDFSFNPFQQSKYWLGDLVDVDESRSIDIKVVAATKAVHQHGSGNAPYIEFLIKGRWVNQGRISAQYLRSGMSVQKTFDSKGAEYVRLREPVKDTLIFKYISTVLM